MNIFRFRLLLAATLLGMMAFGVIVAGALKAEPNQVADAKEPDHVSLPGIGNVYTFPLKGHWYICNPHGVLTHAIEFCHCHEDPRNRTAAEER